MLYLMRASLFIRGILWSGNPARTNLIFQWALYTSTPNVLFTRFYIVLRVPYKRCLVREAAVRCVPTIETERALPLTVCHNTHVSQMFVPSSHFSLTELVKLC